jgi:DHA2 family lincomycin resistance protein-like MFS transporter
MLVVLFATAFIASFNENIVNVGLPDIMETFSIDSGTAQWMVTGYMIVTTIVVSMVAFLQRRFTLRQIFFAGAALFLIGAVGDLVAPNYPLLLAFRLVQSCGTGIFIPTMMATVMAVGSRKKLGTYLAIGNCCITFGPALGPVISGIMVTYFGWRSMFVAPAVVMLVLLVAGAFLVYDIAEAQRVRLDLPSLALSVVGLTAFVYGLSIITSQIVVALAFVAGGIVAIAAFVVRQNRLDEPMLDLTPLHSPRFSVACLLVIVSMMMTFSMSVLLPLYFEGALGTTALVAGVLVLVPILFNAATALVGGRVMDTKGPWPLLPVGFFLIAVGQVLSCIWSPAMDVVSVVGAACLVYMGVGLVMAPSQTAGLRQLPREMNGSGVALMSTFIQLAAAIGPSLFIGVLSTTMADRVAEGATSAYAEALGFSSAVTVAAAIACAGFLISLFYSWRIATKKVAAPSVAPARGRSAGEGSAEASMQTATGRGHEAAGSRGLQSGRAGGRAEVGRVAAGKGFPANMPADVASAIDNSISVSSIMKTDAYTVPASAAVYEAVEAMLDYHTSGLPVVNSRDEVVGFVSDGDIVKSLADVGDQSMVDLTYSLSAFADDENFDERLDKLMRANVMDVATKRVVSIDVDSSIEHACTVLGARRIKKVPVLRHGRLAGTLSRTDVTRCVMQQFLTKNPE